jgi:hypothetical protein
MTKDKIAKLTENEAFNLGKECKDKGYSEHYDPYRNMNTLEGNISKLQASWFEGYNA